MSNYGYIAQMYVSPQVWSNNQQYQQLGTTFICQFILWSFTNNTSYTKYKISSSYLGFGQSSSYETLQSKMYETPALPTKEQAHGTKETYLVSFGIRGYACPCSIPHQFCSLLVAKPLSVFILKTIYSHKWRVEHAIVN